MGASSRSACPYKKIYYNLSSGKSEKCTFCFPQIEAGLPSVCSETCVGRIRYLGVVLYDADQIQAAASAPVIGDFYDEQLKVFLDPHDPKVPAQARLGSISEAAFQRFLTLTPGKLPSEKVQLLEPGRF